MKAIIIKELRENARWALLMLLAIFGLLAWAISADALMGFGLVGMTFQAATVAGFGGAGLILGGLQILQDSTPGRWAFLVHRPISRSRIFWGKAIAGVILYGLVTLLPLGMTIAWAATPGHIAGPFDWHMALPAVADVFGGLMWYCAGLLIAARRARWIGSRLFPAGIAIALSAVSIMFTTSLLEALIPMALGIVYLFIAAQGAFVAGGSWQPQQPAVKVLQTIAVLSGMLMVVPLAAQFVLEAINVVVRPQTTSYRHSYYQLDPEGQFQIVTYDSSVGTTVTDLAGNILFSPSTRQNWGRRLSTTYLRLTDKLPQEKALETWMKNRLSRNFRLPVNHVVPLATDSITASYYLVHQRTIHIYNIRRAEFLGSIGPDGFAGPNQKPKPIEPLAQPWWQQYRVFGGRSFRTGSTVYEIDIAALKITPVFIAPPDEPILDSSELYVISPRDPSTSVQYVIVATRANVRIFRESKEELCVPLMQGQVSLRVGKTDDGRFVLWYSSDPGYSVPSRKQMPPPDIAVFVDGSTAQMLNRIELPPLPAPVFSRAWHNKFLEALCFPPAFLILLLVTALLGEPIPRDEAAMLLGVLGCVAVASCVITFILSRRHSFGRTSSIVWTVVSLLFGIQGLLTLLSMRDWPARVTCTKCSRMRIVTNERCEHCGGVFQPPRSLDTDIFEKASTAPSPA